MISRDEIDTEGTAGWKRSYKRHPDAGGWIELSACGFNAAKTVAIVYARHSCGSPCGGGTFHILQEIDEKGYVCG